MEIKQYLEDIDLVLVMGVEPGRCHQKFLTMVSEKIQHLAFLKKSLRGSYKISVDGGIDHEVLRLVDTLGADIFVSGSAFFSNPEQFRFIL
jgi:ribulose-phosphate 3-epimerase